MNINEVLDIVMLIAEIPLLIYSVVTLFNNLSDSLEGEREAKKHSLLGLGSLFLSFLIWYVCEVFFRTISVFQPFLLHTGAAVLALIFLYLAWGIYRTPNKEQQS